MLVTLYKIGEVHFRLLGTNGFHAKTKNESFTVAGSRCRQNLKNENFTSSFGRLRQNLHQKACCTCSTIIFPHSTNQIIHLWRCRSRCCRHFLNSLFFNSRETCDSFKFSDVYEMQEILLRFTVCPKDGSFSACKLSVIFFVISWRCLRWPPPAIRNLKPGGGGCFHVFLKAQC